jgi:hypothetical protein
VPGRFSGGFWGRADAGRESGDGDGDGDGEGDDDFGKFCWVVSGKGPGLDGRAVIALFGFGAEPLVVRAVALPERAVVALLIFLLCSLRAAGDVLGNKRATLKPSLPPPLPSLLTLCVRKPSLALAFLSGPKGRATMGLGLLAEEALEPRPYTFVDARARRY